jgi:hypothetical protein
MMQCTKRLHKLSRNRSGKSKNHTAILNKCRTQSRGGGAAWVKQALQYDNADAVKG